MTDDFTKAPVSFAEARAAKSRDAELWTPRDALISMLRDIDSGETKPDKMVICYAVTDDRGKDRPGFCVAGASRLESLGLLSNVAMYMEHRSVGD